MDGFEALKPGIKLEVEGKFKEAFEFYQSTDTNKPETLVMMSRVAQFLGRPDISYECVDKLIYENGDRTYKELTKTIGLPSHTVIMPYMEWFGFNNSQLAYSFERPGIRFIYARGSVGKEREVELKDLTPDNARDYRYKGIPLLNACLYGTCIFLEKGLNELDLSDEHDWNVTKLQMQFVAGYVDYCEKLFDFFEPSLVVYGQGYFIAAYILRQFAISRGVDVLAIENTCHKERLLYDTISGVTVTRNSVKNLFWRHEDFLQEKQVNEYWDGYYNNIKKLKQDEHSSPDKAFSGDKKIEKDKKTVLFLAQVGTDSSVLFGLPGYPNQAHVIANVMKTVLENGHRLFIKFHPKEKSGFAPIGQKPYDRLTYRWLNDIPEAKDLLSHENLVMDEDNEYDTYKLIESADICMTNNSQAGLEAACMGKPVITCGQAFYAGNGFTYDTLRPDQLTSTLNNCLEGNNLHTDPLLARKIFYSYLNFASIQKDDEHFFKKVHAEVSKNVAVSHYT